MNLIPATSLHDYEQEDSVSGFGDRERRRERKATRKERRQDRRETRRERKVDRKKQRIVRKQKKVQQRLVPVMVPVQAAPAPSLQPATAVPPPPKRKPGQLLERAVDWVEEVVDEGEEEGPFDEEAEEGDATEGFGAESWGPSVPMGRRLRIQAALGYRAAVIELKPGLYLVAEVPDAVTRQEFGLAPLLAPMMMRAARRSMDEPQERRGPFQNLFRRRQQEPIRYVQVIQQAPSAPPGTAQPPLALPGLAEPSTMMVAAPNVGWADDATVAATYGCDACARSRR